jgi:hypothetical protein
MCYWKSRNHKIKPRFLSSTGILTNHAKVYTDVTLFYQPSTDSYDIFIDINDRYYKHLIVSHITPRTKVCEINW